MESELPDGFMRIFTDSDINQKKAMLKLLSASISAVEAGTVPAPSRVEPLCLKNLTEHVQDIGIDDQLNEFINAELHSFNLAGNKLKTQWLSPTNDTYNYATVVNQPKQISNYPGICRLMELVNSHPSTTGDLDSALVTRYPNANVDLKLHKDNERLISQGSSIASVSFGAKRQLRLVLDGKVLANGKTDNRPDLLLPKSDRSMNVMKPGSQAVMRHAVGKGPQNDPLDNVNGECWSISFRKIIPVANAEEASIPANEIVEVSQHQISPPLSNRRGIVLVAGDSFAARLDSGLLGKGKQEVMNIARGGRKIEQVMTDIEKFLHDHPDLQVKKLFVCVGTNDIRNCRDGIRHLKQPLANLMKFLKSQVPGAKIWFQSLPPIQTNGCKFTAKNVIAMNNMIYYTCSRFKLFYMDIFGSFLNINGSINPYLFPKYDVAKKAFDIHPNKRGMGVLAKAYIYIIHSKWFNPMGY